MTKTQELNQVYTETTKKLTANLDNYTNFLTVVGNLYKYPYYEQILIYEQRPQAVACAEFGLWNKRMNRYVKKGSTGIALINPNDSSLPVRYVFDLADTGEKANSKTPQLWQYLILIRLLLLRFLQQVSAKSHSKFFKKFQTQLLKLKGRLPLLREDVTK